VKPDLTAEYRQVDLGLTLGENVVVNKGVSTGERVVTDGQLRLFPGAQLKIVDNQQKANKEARL
jgi:multidrug efflux system membrane fusion protein